MSGGIRWAYGLNQWDTNIDDFVRHRDHERAFKTIAISGFEAIELTAANFGPWEPFGNPTQIEAHYGSAIGLLRTLDDCGLSAVSSWIYDPAVNFQLELGTGSDPLDRDSHLGIIDSALWLSRTLKDLGGSTLVVRPVGSAWMTGAIDDEGILTLAALWNAAGRATLRLGVRTALHIDFLSGLRLAGGIERLLEATDPELVGVALDTAELAVAGIDPVAFYRAHSDRVWHVQYKDARDRVDDDEAVQQNADSRVRGSGGFREIGRWFFEPSDEGGLVDFEAMTAELRDSRYEGWVVFESDQSPHPAESAMLGGWYLQKVLAPILEG